MANGVSTLPNPTTASSPRNWFRANWSYVWCAFLIVPSLVWICKDHAVWPWDQAWYGQVSADLWFWLGHSLKQWMVTMTEGLSIKPPGIVWIAQFFVPLGTLFGSIEAALLFSVLLTQFAMLVLLFRIGQRIAPGSRLIPAAGVFFAASSQFFVGLSHEMLVEPLQALATAWTFYIALRIQDWPKSRVVVHLGSAIVSGLLAKTTTPLYCLLPCLYCGYFVLRKPGFPNFRNEWKLWPSRILMVVFVFLAVMCALWYFKHFAEAWQHARDSSSGDVSLNYGSRDSISNKLVLWWGLFVQAFVGPYLPWVCLGAIVVAASLQTLRGRAHSDRPSVQPVAIFSVIEIALIVFIFSLNIAVEPRYLYALLPCAAILFMQICVFLPARAVAVLMVLTSVQWVAVNAAALKLTSGIPKQSQWLLPVHPDRSQYDELARVVRLTDMPGRYNIVGVEEPWMNANSASFFAAKQSLKAGEHGYYTSLGYAQQDVDAAVRRIEELQSPYVITRAEANQVVPPNFVNIVSLPVLARMRHDPRFTPASFDSPDGVLIFRFSPGTPAIPEAPDKSSNRVEKDSADPQSAPALISAAKPQNRGKSSLGWVNGRLPVPEGRARIFNVPGGVLHSCLGWAFDDVENSTPENVWLEFSNSVTARHYYWRVKRYSRPELADALKLPSIRMAGIQCHEPGLRLPPGTYSTKIYQAVGKKVIVADLNTYESPPVVVVQ
jgi:hypothetical protein